MALVGVGNATIWKPNPRVSASLPTSSQKQALAITRPGMFELYDSPTKITVAGQGKVALAIGRSADVMLGQLTKTTWKLPDKKMTPPY